MKAPSIIPSGSAIVREAIIVIAGAMLAAAVLQAVPGLRDWIKRQLP